MVVAAIVVGAVSAAVNGRAGGPVPIFRQDLQPFGYVIKGNSSTVNHFDLSFLSEDLLLVSANVRAFTQQTEPLFAEGRGNLLLFDVARKSLMRRAEQTLVADSNVVRATRDGRFVALGLSGLSLCSTDLSCGAPLPTAGPVEVSPDGRMLVVGGNRQTARLVLESGTFKEIASFPWNSGAIEVAGSAILLGGSDLTAISGSKQEHRFVSLDAYAQFLNGDLVAGYTERAHEPKKLVTQTLDGIVKYETVLVSSWYETKIIPATNGKRFCIDEIGYDKFSLPNLLGYGDVPFHFERVRALESDTGKTLFELRWDPRPYTGYMVKPAISPDGHRLAIVRHGFVEVFEIP
jgi:hypothetical protein